MRRLAIAALLLSLTSVAARRGELAPPDWVAEAAETGGTDRAAAITSLERYLAGKTDPEIEPWALVWAGEQRRLSGENNKARAWFEKAAERYPAHPTKEAAVLGMALVDAETSLSGNTLATLQLIGDRAIPPTMNADRYRLLARVGADEGTQSSKVRELARRSLEYAQGDPTVVARVRGSLADLLPADGAAPTSSQAADVAALEQIRAALRARDYDGAAAQGKRFAEAFPDSPLLSTAQGLTRRAEARDPQVANRVGVLLPLSGEYAPPGERLKAAIAWANDREGGPLELIFVDTKGDPATAVAQLDKLVLEKGCVAVLGPLLKPEIEAAARAAQTLEVPLVALGKDDPTAAGDYVFNAQLTVEEQVDAMAAFAIQRRNLTTFAVLYPKNAYGDNARDLFTASVTRLGGQVVKVEGYEPDAKDFLDVARRLGSKDFKAQAGELARLRREAEAKGQDPSKVTLPPKVDFQAIFIPDSVQRSSLVVSALAYEEFSVGAFRAHRGDTPVVLLGLNGWNSADLARVGGQYMRGSLFVDAFDEGAADASSFVSAYERAHGRKPMVLDAVASDMTRVVAAAARKAGADRQAMRGQLVSATVEAPISGGDQFGEDRALDHEIQVLTLTSGGITAAPQMDPDAAPPPQ